MVTVEKTAFVENMDRSPMAVTGMMPRNSSRIALADTISMAIARHRSNLVRIFLHPCRNLYLQITLHTHLQKKAGLQRLLLVY